MLVQLYEFLSTEGFQPHGMCLLWRPDVFWAHVISDLTITLSYFSIPAALIYLAVRRSDLVYRWVFYLFGAFIIACGFTHAFGLWTMWVPDYGVQAIFKVVTAMVSVATAVALWPLMPRLIAMPSARQLEDKNMALAAEIKVRQSTEAELQSLNDELEKRVDERTASLALANAKLVASRAQAEQANSAKSEFLAKMSHELRTPLNAIIGFSDVIRQERIGSDRNAKYREYAGHIHDSGRHLLDLINNVLDLSKIESGLEEVKAEAADPKALSVGVMTLVGESAQRRRIDLSLQAPDRCPVLIADSRKVKQILINLLSNAIKFTPEGGRVTLKVEPQSSNGCLFTVTDSGIGIAAADIGKALTPFRQVDSQLARNNEGTGLGLPLAKSLAEMHGGTIQLQSEIGVGTTVTVFIPSGSLCQPSPLMTAFQAAR